MSKFANVMWVIALLGFGFIIGIIIVEPDIEPIAPVYSIYEYNYNQTIVMRYREHVLSYEYVSSGRHIVSISNGVNNIPPKLMNNQDEAIDFCRIYLEDRRREDQL